MEEKEDAQAQTQKTPQEDKGAEEKVSSRK